MEGGNCIKRGFGRLRILFPSIVLRFVREYSKMGCFACLGGHLGGHLEGHMAAVIGEVRYPIITQKKVLLAVCYGFAYPYGGCAYRDNLHYALNVN